MSTKADYANVNVRVMNTQNSDNRVFNLKNNKRPQFKNMIGVARLVQMIKWSCQTINYTRYRCSMARRASHATINYGLMT